MRKFILMTLLFIVLFIILINTIMSDHYPPVAQFFYFTVFDTNTKLPIYSRYNFNFELYAHEKNIQTNDKQIIFNFFITENGVDYSKPTVVQPQLQKYFTPITNEMIDYINNYGYTNHSNYMTTVDPYTYIDTPILYKQQFDLIPYNDTQIRFIQDYFYNNFNTPVNDNNLYYTKYNFDFDTYSNYFQVYGTKLVIFTDFVIRCIYLSSSLVGAYGYGLPADFIKYFLYVENLEKYLNEYSVTSNILTVYKNPNNIDFESYGKLNHDLVNKSNDELKHHYYLYGQFELRQFEYIKEKLQNSERLQNSLGIVNTIYGNSFATGFLYKYEGEIYLLTAYHLVTNKIINIITASFDIQNINTSLSENVTTTAQFKLVGYDAFSDILVARYDPTLPYNIFNKNAEVINSINIIQINNNYRASNGEPVFFSGNIELNTINSCITGTIATPNHTGAFDEETFLGPPASVLIRAPSSNGTSGTPIILGDPNSRDGNLIFIGVLNSVLDEHITQVISSKIYVNVVNNIILVDIFLKSLYKGNIVNINYLQKIGYPQVWLGTIGCYFNSVTSPYEYVELSTMDYIGGYLIKKFVVGFDTDKKQFVTDAFNLGTQTTIQLNTPLLNSKLYKQFLEGSNLPIVLKSVTFFNGLNSEFQKFNIGKYGNQVSLNTITYGFTPISTIANPEYGKDKEILPTANIYGLMTIEYYYYNGVSYVLDSEVIGSDQSSWFNNYTDGMGNTFYQNRWQLPFILKPYLQPYELKSDSLLRSYNEAETYYKQNYNGNTKLNISSANVGRKPNLKYHYS